MNKITTTSSVTPTTTETCKAIVISIAFVSAVEQGISLYLRVNQPNEAGLEGDIVGMA